MPPKKKDVEVAPVVEPTPVQAADASVALYKDRSGAARATGPTEGESYRGTMAKLAREAAGLPPLPEEGV